MRTGISCLLVLSLPLPALAQVNPYEEAVEARRAGDPEQAVALLRPLLEADPGNVDARLQLGFALLALGRLAEAEQSFRATLAAAPDYADARLGLALIAQRRGDRAAALVELEQIPADYAAADALRAQLTVASMADRTWRFDIDGSYSALEGDRSDWRKLAIQLRHELSSDTALSGQAQAERRFGLGDVYGEIRIDKALSDDVRAYASVGATAEPDFLPEWQLSLGGSMRVRDGGNATVLTLDAREAQYAGGDIQTVTPGLEQYFADGRAWFTARWINVFDELGAHHNGYLARLDGFITNRLRLFGGFSDAPDTSAGVVIDTNAVFGGAVLNIGADTTLRLSAAREDREVGDDRTEISLGVGFAF